MNKAEFLKELEFHLQKMNDSEKNKFITYYDEMISDYVENGRTEAEAVIKIGTPLNIAKELLEGYDNVKLNLPSTGNKFLNISIAIIGFPLWGSVLLTIALLVFSIYVMIWCVPVAAGAGCVGFFSSAIIGLIGTPLVMIRSIPLGVMQLGTSMASIGISVLLGIATVSMSKSFVGITKKFNGKLVQLFRKRAVVR